MCGICGIVYKDKERRVDPDLLTGMADSIRHRGPDDSGQYIHQNVGLGHLRLSIVDLEHGHQPMSDLNERYWISFNGEIYNHSAIRKDLEQKGYHYRTNCDTESIIHSFAEYGTASLHKMRGMFAFAIYDAVEDYLFIARDRLGIKPLYYIDTDRFFAFASEIKALLQIPEVKPVVNHKALLQTLALKYTCDDSTMFAGIRKLEPGHFLELKDGVLSVVRYWDCHSIEINDDITMEEATSHLRALFDESVRMRLMADVPLGMFLSGGIDSTIISVRMAKMVERQIATFSVAFKEREANELRYARLAAEHANADQHEITMTTEDFFQLLPRMIYHEDEPIAHPSSVALHKVSELASRYVKVVLTGEGSDELFGGYERYYQTLYNIRADGMIFKFLPRAVRRRIFRPLLDMLPYKFPYRNKAVRTTMYLDADLPTIFLDNYSTFSRARLKQLFSGREWSDVEIESVYQGYFAHFDNAAYSSLLPKILYADIKTYLLELLMKQDQMSMAASIESRVPFLDHELVEFAFSLPDHLKIKGFNTKRILRETFGSEIPDEILNRPKEGFPVPIKRWFANEYYSVAREMILGDDSFCGDTFNRELIGSYFDLHRAGKYNYSDQIWTLLNLEMWHKIFIEQHKFEDVTVAAV